MPRRFDILVVDDDRLLVKSLAGVLRNAGYDVRTAFGGEAGLAAVREKRPDLILLDVMMPKLGGLDVCRRLRADDASLPIVFLTALESTESEIEGLSAGGDLYIPKSAPDELLLARIASVLRSRGAADGTGDFAFGDWHVDVSALVLRNAAGEVLPISERELYLLRLFADNPSEVFTREYLQERIWDDGRLLTDNSLSVAVHALRKKLGPSGDSIVTLRGVGYSYR